MNNPDDNVALAREGMEAFQRRDIEGILAFLSPEVEVYSQEDLPNSGEFHGHDGYLQWVGNWLDVWESFEVEPLDFEPIGERHVLVPTRQLGIGKGSGIEVRMTVCFMVEIHERLATRLHFYAEREKALAAAEAGEAAA
jgi:ketosteroid isomerase-like protein